MKRTFIVAAVCLLTLAGQLLQCGKKGNPVEVPRAEPTAPRIVSVHPADGAAGVPRNTLVLVTFDRAMDQPATAGALTVAGMTGTASWKYNILVFRPDSLYGDGDTVRFAVSAAARDNFGTPLAAAAAYQFVCGAAADSTPPAVAAHSPADSGAALNAAVYAACSEKLAPWSDGAITLRQGATPVPGSAGVVGDSVLRFTPRTLGALTTYTASVDTTCMDLCGNRMAATHSWTFTTAADNVAPTIHGTTPANGDTLVPVNAPVRIRFSEPMDTAATRAATTHHPALHCRTAWTNDTLMTLTMTDTLSFHTAHQVTVGTGAMDKAGNHLASAHQFSFTTARGLYVTCNTDNRTSLYQQHDLKPEGTIPSLPSVGQIRMSPDGSRAYLLDNDGVKVLDLRDHNRIIDTIALAGNCYGLAVSPNGLRLAVSDPVQNCVYLITAATGQVPDTIIMAVAGAAPKGVVFSGNSRYLYVACTNSNHVQIYDLNNLGLPPVQISSAYDGEEMAARPSGDIVFAACGPGVTAVNTSDNSWRYNITVAGTPHPFGLAVSPDGQHLVVSWYNLTQVSIYDAMTGAHIANVNVGSNPKGLCYSPDGRYLYVANSGSGTVTPIARSGAAYTPATAVTVGAGPWGIAVTP